MSTISGQTFADRFEALTSNIGTVIKGKDDVVRLCLIGMLAQGHILLEDMPGTGKTMLSRAISASISASDARIQCTPDLLPADITGSTVVDRATGEFRFRPGPVFSNILLADEINRATPKTQSEEEIELILETADAWAIDGDGLSVNVQKGTIDMPDEAAMVTQVQESAGEQETITELDTPLGQGIAAVFKMQPFEAGDPLEDAAIIYLPTPQGEAIMLVIYGNSAEDVQAVVDLAAQTASAEG